MGTLFTIIQLIICIAMIAIVIPKKNIPAKTWLLVFLFSLLVSAVLILCMRFYFIGENYDFDATISFYEIIGMSRSIIDIGGWLALLLFIIKFKSAPVNNNQPPKKSETPYTETLGSKTPAVSTAQYLYFFGFAVVIGGCIAAPITLPYIFGLFGTEAAEIYQSYPANRKLFFCLLLVGLASFAYADELRFSLLKYITGLVILGGAIASQAVKEYYSGKGVLLPVGLLGIAYATIFGHLGLWICNAITGKKERNKTIAIVLALIIFPLIAVSTFVNTVNRNYDIPVAAVKSEPATNAAEPYARVDEPSPVISEIDIFEIETEFAEESTHENGLTVRRPVKFSTSQAETGFVFTETGKIRAPRFIVLKASNTEPIVTLKKRRTRDDGSTIAYSINKLGVGSGGTEYELSSIRKSGDRWITLNAIEQSEVGLPDFKIAWILMDTAQLLQPKKNSTSTLDYATP